MQTETTSSFRLDTVEQRPSSFKKVGIAAFIAGRYLFGSFFLYGCYHKTIRHWLTSPTLRQHFVQRLSEIDPESFQAAYLRYFAIPWYRPIAWVLTLGQFTVATSMIFGVAVRPSAALALFLLLNISAGSYYNASMPPFIIYAIMLMALPSGQWLGLDRVLHKKYPDTIWFR